MIKCKETAKPMLRGAGTHFCRGSNTIHTQQEMNRNQFLQL